MDGYIAEIFQSLQGEGPYQGLPQLFIRLFGCNLSCAFCDTRLFSYRRWSAQELLSHISRFSGYHSISLTGGEPLQQTSFLQELLPRLKQAKKTIYLETNGVFYKEAEKLINYIDIVAMDFKLPSSTDMPDFWREHREFLRLVREKEVFVKAVITPATHIVDIAIALAIIKEIRPHTLLVLQPVYHHQNQMEEKLRYLESFITRHSVAVRIMVQLHKQLSIR